mgnify:CR=1 FL=1|tara:strand:+ start:1194 stop:1808 length:615 start_codon:yes stop_codon:yes gene_type:complete
MNFFVWTQLALVCLLGAMSPGPSLAVVIRNSVAYSRFAGISCSIGHGIGMSIYATIVIIGLGFIIQSYSNLFFIIQIIGSIFLVFLGLLFIIKSKKKIEIHNNAVNANSFFQGFLIAIFNPKILIWFTAIYSHFIRIEADFFEKTVLVSTASIIDALWYSLVTILVTGYNFKNFIVKYNSIIQKSMGILLIIIAAGLFIKLIMV